MLNAEGASVSLKPITLTYEGDLLGNIQQALAGLQGFCVMALELIQVAIFKYINGFYTPRGKHSTLGWIAGGVRGKSRII